MKSRVCQQEMADLKLLFIGIFTYKTQRVSVITGSFIMRKIKTKKENKYLDIVV